MKRRVAILISGRGSNMAALIEATKAADFPAETVVVISNKADAGGLAKAQASGVSTVIIESKGCWNSDLNTALSNQLVDKYLMTPGSNAGIYLIGYFDCQRWETSEHAKRPHGQHDLDEIRVEQTQKAEQLSALKSVIVTAFVLDCRLHFSSDSPGHRIIT